MRVVIISKEKNGEKEAIGVSLSESQAKKYIRDEALKDCSLEMIDFPSKTKEISECLYLAFKPQDGDQNSVLVGYFTNRFKAQQASQPGGHISRIPLVENRGKASARPSLNPRDNAESKNRKDVAKTAKHKAKPNDAASRNFRKIRILLALVGLWMLAIIMIIVLAPGSQYEWGENVESVDFLPNYCRNISYYKSERFTVFEFPCNDEIFKRFAFDQKLIYKELEKQTRAKTYRQYAEIDWNAPEGLGDAEQWNLWKDLSQPTVEEGYYIYAKINYTGDVYGLYDGAAKRLYYWEKAPTSGKRSMQGKQ